MKFCVLILDALQLEHVKRLRGRAGQCLEMSRDIGFAGEDSIVSRSPNGRIYRNIHWSADHWTRTEYVIAGPSDWYFPRPVHPDCLVVRKPNEGEIFVSDAAVLWLSSDKAIELTGTLAARLFGGRHGDIVGDLGECLSHQVFEECLNMLTAEYGHELEGDVGRFLIDELTRAVGATTLTGADEDVILKIAARVHESILSFLDRAAG